MAKNEKSEKKGKFGLFGWAVKKLLSTIPGKIGVGVAAFVGITAGFEIGPVGAFFMACMAGFAAGAVAYGIKAAVHQLHAQESTAGIEAARKHREERETMLLDKLKTVGLDDDAGVVRKMLEARDAIFKRCEGPDVEEKTGAPTLELVSKIASSAVHRSEELLDLTRRMNDPHLDAPGNAETKVEACRADLIRAYQAVADSRSRILLFKEPTAELFEDADKPALGSLADQLQEETAVLQGIDRRLRGLDVGLEISPPGSQDTSKTTYGVDSRMESES